jgi:protease-4
LASDAIWREITLSKKEKPVVVSMGDYAASGGYYISCNADSVFADAGTITGSIGVFSLLPNMQKLFNDKLGITFDGVKTAPYADMGGVNRPLTEPEKRFLQLSIDSIYSTFKQRVADGRKTDINFIDSIAQGHVYTGQRAISLKLVDRTGTLQDAVNCAARMAKAKAIRSKNTRRKNHSGKS